MLSFASLSVRPGLYTLFEDYVVRLSTPNLRPILKSLILSLLPALEDETSEDFDRAFRILETLEQQFSPSSNEHTTKGDKDGYFWQCLFLAVITSPSRRQGALNFLMHKLPKFSSYSKEGHSAIPSTPNGPSKLSPLAEAVISPEPGLLIRCFACGLSDPQILIQRGFLDLLVTNLLLDSPLLQSRVRTEDLDRLVSSAAQVLLRREMSLNRRLWSWFLGLDPTVKAHESQPPSPNIQRNQSAGAGTDWQFNYFSTFGRKPLERCILAMFKRNTTSPAQRARPFRICLSLMDRWEIGGSIAPHILLPGLESAYQYSLLASAEDTTEVMRSVSFFFDGIEATLIWENLFKLLKDATAPNNDLDNVHLFAWTVQRFNINDEEMLTVHIPYAAIYLLSLLEDSDLETLSASRRATLFDITLTLLEMIPERAFTSHSKDSQRSDVLSARKRSTEDIRKDLDEFYRAREHPTNKERPIEGEAAAEILFELMSSLMLRALDRDMDSTFGSAVALLLNLHSKAPVLISSGQNELSSAIMQALHATATETRTLAFPTINSCILLLTALASSLYSDPIIMKPKVLDMQPFIIAQIWRFLSPNFPKYNVEAVKAIWQFRDLVSPEDSVEASLIGLVRDGLQRSASDYNRVDTCRRFAVLWNHTVPASSNTKAGLKGFTRRGSTIPSFTDAKQALHRQKILTDSLMLILDLLQDPVDVAFDFVTGWLRGLVSLDHVLDIHFDFLAKLLRIPAVPGSDKGKRVTRSGDQRLRELVYIVEHILNILKHGKEWVWECLGNTHPSLFDESDAMDGLEMLAECCIRFLCSDEDYSQRLEMKSIELLDVLLVAPSAERLKSLDLDARLIDYLMKSLSANNAALQGQLLRLINKSLKLRVILEAPEPQVDTRSTGPVSVKGASATGGWHSPNASNTSLVASPPPQLLSCLRMGFSSSAAREHLDQWLTFLSSILPVFAGAIFASVIPLVECLCAELNKTHNELVSTSKTVSAVTTIAPETTAMTLLEALEMVLARAHECLTEDHSAESVPKAVPQSRTRLGNMTSGVFKSEGPPSRTAPANSRLAVILIFQDAIRTSVKLWTWATHSTEMEDFDKTSAATTTYNALKIRNRTRYLLEQMFAIEPLESLEVVILNWCYTLDLRQAAATIDLLHVMKGLRPKNIVPAILDSICSRTNPSVLPAPRQSSQTVDLSALDVALFLLAYLHSTEDDAMDEVWSDCMAFLRDVLSNPMPYRMVLPALLSLILLLAQKADNTNFGEQHKMRRDLGDVFQRTLAATFTTLPSGYVLESGVSETEPLTNDVSNSSVGRRATKLTIVLKEVVANIEVILETADRTLTAINTISSNLIAPFMHAKSFPSNITSDLLVLLLQMSKKAPLAKPWKKDLLDAFNDPKLLATPVVQMENDWFPVLHQWCLYDKERMPELLSRLSPPSSAGIMFGVGANAARLEADRKTQLNLRRICILLLSSPEDTFVMHSRIIEEKVVELFEASPSSSPSAATKADLFMLCRAVVLSTSAVHLAPFWPTINDNLQSALTSLIPNASNSNSFGNLSLLQACKLLDLLIALSPDDFQLHEWLYVTDTIDAVYQPTGWNPSALGDQVAEALTSDGIDDTNGMIPSTPITSGMSGRRRPLLNNDSVSDKEDLKAASRDEFARAIIRPFLSQLSIHAYEGVYSMDTTDIGSCRRNLLDDLLDLSTIAE